MNAGCGALGARQPAGGPDAKVERTRPSIHGGVGKAIKLLRSTDQIKAFFGDLIAAMNGLEPAEPDNELYRKRIDSANAIWERVNKADPVTTTTLNGCSSEFVVHRCPRSKRRRNTVRRRSTGK